jgi:hypothetical protein
VPDKQGFDNLPRWGVIHYRCVECGWPEEAKPMSQRQRERHHRVHIRAREREIAKARKASLAKARKARNLSLAKGSTYDQLAQEGTTC